MKIDVEELAGGRELINSLAGKNAGFPWLAILRADGTVVITSDDPDRGNIGSPRAKWEIEHWNVMMRVSVSRITEEEIQHMARTWAEDRPGS